jgi:hypothetical protein
MAAGGEKATSAEPIRPDAPEMAICMLGTPE